VLSRLSKEEVSLLAWSLGAGGVGSEGEAWSFMTWPQAKEETFTWGGFCLNSSPGDPQPWADRPKEGWIYPKNSYIVLTFCNSFHDDRTFLQMELLAMSRELLFERLDQHLKSKEVTLSQLAKHLETEEASILKIFENKDCTFGCMEKICQFIGMTMHELWQGMPKVIKPLDQLTQQQEIEFLSNKKLFVVAVCAMHLWTFQDILERVALNKIELLQLLNRLQEIGFLQLNPGNRIKLLLSSQFGWIQDGPIKKMIRRESQDFFAYSFEAPDDLLHIFNVYITKAAHQEFRQQLIEVVNRYRQQIQIEADVPLEEKKLVSLCIASRPWMPGFMQSQFRKPLT
jgi:DNA-binding Xre family transcriptional regulator